MRDPAYAPEHMHGGDEFGIAFIGEVGGRTDVFVRLNGHVANVTNTPDLDESDPSWQAIPEHPMVDRRWDRFYDEIAWLYDEGITTGCAPERYCPKAPVLRGEMASFLFRAFALEPTAEDFFDDDAGSTHEAAINAMAAAGVTTGCAPSAYCPGGVVTRAQMASFLARVLELPPSMTDHFTDDDGSTHEADINALADAGITTGCAPDLYCPEKRLLRSELAGFLYRILAD